MARSLILEIKFLLTSILNNKDREFRSRTLGEVMDLLSEIEMNTTKAEEAIKALEVKDEKKADKLIEQMLKDVDKQEYGK